MPLSEMASEITGRFRFKGLVYLDFDSVFDLIAAGLFCAVGRMDAYYYVPHACACLECAHATKTAPDGRVHCAKYPPLDIKMTEVSARHVRFCQSVVGFGGVTGLGFAVLTAISGAQWLFARTPMSPKPTWHNRLRQSAPFGAMLFPAVAVPFLWPCGFVPV